MSEAATASSGELFVTHEDLVVAGRYRLGARLGSGAMGVVWQAHDDRLHRTVAVKQLILQPGLTAAQSEEAHQRTMREGRIAARLSHPNAISVYDAVEHDGEPWLIMEYLPSRSLAAVIAEQGPVQPEEAARIGSQVAAALVAAHSAGIVHRDVKPANVLLGEDGTVKITDFGISRAVGDVTVTATGMLAGTPAYLAPEVAKGQEPTASSDVFSLGSTLYTAVEGRSPFGLGENTLALLYAVAAGKVDPPQHAGPLTALLMRLLRTDPAERPTMREAMGSLGAVAAGKAVLAAETTQVMSPIRVPPPPQAPTPPQGLHATRLDVRPFSEPLPSGPVPAGPPPRGPLPAPAPSTGRNSVRSVVFTVLAILAAALLGILVASLLTDTKRSSSQQRSVPPTTSTTKSTSPTTSATPSSTATQPATDPEDAIRDYYAMLPGNAAQAWDLMTDRAQRRSGGQDGYTNFWSKISSVQVLSTRSAGNRVAATLRFTTTDGKETTEAYVFELAERDGRLLIDKFGQHGRGNDRDDGDG
jgi:eukaryotic-like serine/threonine-protein kinase